MFFSLFSFLRAPSLWVVALLTIGTAPAARAQSAATRQWWVYLSPAEAAALYHAPNFPTIKAEADTYALNGSSWPRTGMDQSSTWVHDQSIEMELTGATYLALKWGKYHGNQALELQPYLDRLTIQWRQVVTGGPENVYSQSIPHYSGMYISRGNTPFIPGWQEGDLAMRSWMPGSLESYDTIRDDLSSDDRILIDTWMRAMAAKLWSNAYDSYQNRGASSHGQAHILALMLQDKTLFNSYFTNADTDTSGVHHLGWQFLPEWFDYAPYLDSYFPQRPGFSLQIGIDDGPHGLNINRHTFHTAQAITHAARTGGDSAWDILNLPNQGLLAAEVDTWYDIAGPLNQAFTEYMDAVEASQAVQVSPTVGPQISTTPGSIDPTILYGYAFIQPRFLDAGISYGVASWFQDEVPSGQYLLWRERDRLLAGVPGALPALPSTISTNGGGLVETRITPQRGLFTCEFDVFIGGAGPREDIALQDGTTAPASGFPSGKAVAFIRVGSTIQATKNGALTQDATVNVAVGGTYHVREVVNVPAQTYDVYVTPPGAAEVKLAAGYAFTPPSTGSPRPLTYWSTIHRGGSYLVTTSNFAIRKPDGLEVSVSAPVEEANFHTGSNIVINARAAATGAAIAKVEFFVDASQLNEMGTTFPAAVNLARLGQATAAPYTFTWASAPAGDWALTARVTDANGRSWDSEAVNIHVGAGTAGLPQNWTSQDVAAPGAAPGVGPNSGQTGSSAVLAPLAAPTAATVFAVNGSGDGLADPSDAVQFAYQRLHGDGQITARVLVSNPIPQGNNLKYPHGGLMLRGGLGAGDVEAFVGTHWQGTLPNKANTNNVSGATPGTFIYRAAANGTPKFLASAFTGGLVLDDDAGTVSTATFYARLVRAGDVVTAYKSTDNTTFTQVGTVTFGSGVLPTDVFIGLASCAGDNVSMNYAEFDNVAVVPNAATAGSAITPLVKPPTGLVASAASPAQVNLTWSDNATDETGYKVERSIDGGIYWTQIATPGAGANSYADTGCSPAATYTYRVRATNARGDSLYSNADTATTAQSATNAGPSGLTAAALSPTQISLAWADNSYDEDSFRVEQSPNGSAWTQTASLPANSTGYVASGLTPATAYSFRVRSATGTAFSAYTNTASAATAAAPVLPAAATNLVATADSSNQVHLTWTDAAGVNADTYQIQRSRNGEDFAPLAVLAGGRNEATDHDSVLPATAYTYRVAPANAAGTAAWSNLAKVTTPPPPPAAPGNAVATANSGTSVTVTWMDNSGNETGFRVYRLSGQNISNTGNPDFNDAAPNAWLAQLSAGVTTYTDTTVAAGNSYGYRVTAYNAAGGESAFTDEARVNTPSNTAGPTAPTGVAATAGADNKNNPQVTVAWNCASPAVAPSGFKVERSGDGGAHWTQIRLVAYSAAATAYSFTDNSAYSGSPLPGTPYLYRVRSYNNGGNGNSAFVAAAGVTTPGTPPPPMGPDELTATAASGTQINLAWTDYALNATSYQVRRSTDGVNFATAATLGANAASYPDTGLTPNTTYYYRVVATGSGGDSANSNMASDTTVLLIPAAPSGLTATASGSGSINLKWTDNSAIESGFSVERADGTGTGAFTVVGSPAANATAYTDGGLAAAHTYTYRVRAVNAQGSSGASNNATAATTSPIAAWKTAHFGANAGNAAVAGDLADPDGDGLTNLMEYALGSDPLAPSLAGVPTAGSVAVGGSVYRTLTFKRPVAVTDVTYTVEVSGGLAAGWQTGSVYPAAGTGSPMDVNTVQVSRTTDGNGVETVTVRDGVAVGAGGNGGGGRFLRLRVAR